MAEHKHSKNRHEDRIVNQHGRRIWYRDWYCSCGHLVISDLRRSKKLDKDKK